MQVKELFTWLFILFEEAEICAYERRTYDCKSGWRVARLCICCRNDIERYFLLRPLKLRSAPGVLPALADVVHDRQGADYEHRHGKDDQYGGFHCDLATAGPKAYRSLNFRRSK